MRTAIKLFEQELKSEIDSNIKIVYSEKPKTIGWKLFGIGSANYFEDYVDLPEIMRCIKEQIEKSLIKIGIKTLKRRKK